MADEVMYEEDFPCPCGNGVLRIEVLEHDTWVSGQSTRETLRCPECSKNYKPMFLPNHVLVRRSDADKIEQKQHELYTGRRAVGAKAVDRYLPQFSEHINALKFKTAMHEALGRPSSLEKFRRDARYGLEDLIKNSLSHNPLQALKRLGIEDREIAEELQAITREEDELQKYSANVEKHKIPGIDDLHRRKFRAI